MAHMVMLSFYSYDFLNTLVKKDCLLEVFQVVKCISNGRAIPKGQIFSKLLELVSSILYIRRLYPPTLSSEVSVVSGNI